jgi:glycosyltransferase involved in cell wall biosynthesis
MHVVLDARYISRRQSGVGAYAQRLITGLATIDHENRYTCLVAADGPGLPVSQANVAAAPTDVSFEDHLRGDLWLLGYLPFRLRALRTDVYHGPAVFLPHVKLGYGTVVTIHDLVSFLFPETVPRKYSLYMRLMTRLAVRSADRIIAVSHATKTDLVQILRVPPAKIAVIHEAVGPEFSRLPSPEAIEGVVRRYGLQPPYCLFVGNLEPRKNLPGLIEAFAQVRRRLEGVGVSAQLVLAGTRAWLHAGIFRAVEAHGLAAAVVFTDYVPVGDLPALYAGATCFVFPSLYEGFGLPVLEAMASGTPVVATPRAVAGLALGTGEEVLVADDAAGLATAAVALLRDPARARAQARAARALVERRYRWEESAAGVEAAWRAAVD